MRRALWLFGLALLPRLAAIGRYVTPDEPIWVYRSLKFREALLAGDWANTIQSGHPGVITTWLGAIAIQLQLWFDPAGANQLAWLNKLYWLSPENPEAFRHLAYFLNGGRLAVALLTALGLVAIYAVGCQLFSEPTAFIGSLILALDPFPAGLSGLFHLDGLLATFLLLALLLAVWLARRPSPSLALLCGFATALAMLAKTPGLLLLAFIPGLWLLSWQNNWRSLLVPAGLWGVAVGLTILILLPATWAAPVQVWQQLTGLTGRLIDSAIRPTFFLGQAELDHGPAFYPIVVLLRLSPIVTVGLGLWARELWQAGRKGLARPEHWLMLLALIFLLFISLAAKKFDRYALPALMALSLLAGLSLSQNRARWLLVAGQALYLLASWPYPLTAYNWLAGGGWAAGYVLPAGWGEAAGAGGRWLSQQPEQPQLFTNAIASAAPFYDGPIYPYQESYLALFRPGDLILWLEQDRQLEPNQFSTGTPLQHLTLNGVDQAYFYPAGSTPAPLTLAPQALTFGQEIGLTAAGNGAQPGDGLIALSWLARPVALSPSYTLRLELLDPAGQALVSREMPLLNQAAQLPHHWPADTPQLALYPSLVPPDLPPGLYQVSVSLFNDEGAKLGLFQNDGRFVGTSANVTTLTVSQPAIQAPFTIANPLPAGPGLRGYDHLPTVASTGQKIAFDVWWQAAEPGRETLTLWLGDYPLGAELDSHNWPPSHIYHIRPSWQIPLNVPAGTYPLRLAWANQSRPVGELTIAAVERQFELPAGLEPLAVQLGNLAYLQEVAISQEGDTLHLRLVWQANQTDGNDYTIFIHLRDQNGVMVDQLDPQPQPPTSLWLAGQVIVGNYELKLAPAGILTLAIGLYNPQNGQRLPLYLPNGQRQANDQYQLLIEP